jgi:hypothetical protein
VAHIVDDEAVNCLIISPATRAPKISCNFALPILALLTFGSESLHRLFSSRAAAVAAPLEGRLQCAARGPEAAMAPKRWRLPGAALQLVELPHFRYNMATRAGLEVALAHNLRGLLHLLPLAHNGMVMYELDPNS